MAKKKPSAPKPARARPAAKRTPADLVPAGYAELLANIKRCVHTAQVRAAVAVNRELLLLNWRIGQDILRRQRDEGWGPR